MHPPALFAPVCTYAPAPPLRWPLCRPSPPGAATVPSRPLRLSAALPAPSTSTSRASRPPTSTASRTPRPRRRLYLPQPARVPGNLPPAPPTVSNHWEKSFQPLENPPTASAGNRAESCQTSPRGMNPPRPYPASRATVQASKGSFPRSGRFSTSTATRPGMDKRPAAAARLALRPCSHRGKVLARAARSRAPAGILRPRPPAPSLLHPCCQPPATVFSGQTSPRGGIPRPRPRPSGRVIEASRPLSACFRPLPPSASNRPARATLPHSVTLPDGSTALQAASPADRPSSTSTAPPPDATRAHRQLVRIFDKFNPTTKSPPPRCGGRGGGATVPNHALPGITKRGHKPHLLGFFIMSLTHALKSPETVMPFRLASLFHHATKSPSNTTRNLRARLFFAPLFAVAFVVFISVAPCEKPAPCAVEWGRKPRHARNGQTVF